MIAVEYGDGSFEVVVLEDLSDFRVNRESSDLFGGRPWLPWRTDVMVSGYGEIHRYRDRPEWFPPPSAAALPPPARSIEET